MRFIFINFQIGEDRCIEFSSQKSQRPATFTFSELVYSPVIQPQLFDTSHAYIRINLLTFRSKSIVPKLSPTIQTSPTTKQLPFAFQTKSILRKLPQRKKSFFLPAPSEKAFDLIDMCCQLVPNHAFQVSLFFSDFLSFLVKQFKHHPHIVF